MGFPRPFGKYTLLAHLAVGGMADVFLAQQKGPAGFEKECVIKRILPHLGMDQDFVQMFLDEARIAARLSHPNIVQIFDLGQVGRDYFLAMEYIDGVDFEHLVGRAQDRGPKIPWPVALRVMADVAAGLDYAHNARDGAGRPLRLVHRDVSPSNVMVGWGGMAKILDFGIAKAVSTNIKRSKTEVGTVKGKIPYMSPEQLQGLELDGRSDVFSLGVILYEALCGARPFPAETAAQLTMQILHDEPQSPELLTEDFPAGLKPILFRALAKQPQDRWQSARDFQRGLEAFLAEEHSSCTAYDVEAYLRQVYPEEQRPRRLRVSVSGGEGAEHSAESAAGGPSGPDSEGTGDQGGGARPGREGNMRGDKRDQMGSVTDLHQGPGGGRADLRDMQHGFEDLEDHRGRRRGGGWLLPVIGLLVVGTGVALFAVRDYMVKKEGADKGAATADAGTAAPKAALPDLAPATPPAAAAAAGKDDGKAAGKDDGKAAGKDDGKAAKPKEVAAKPKEETPKKPDAPKKPEPVRHRPEKVEKPTELPRLPSPPPADPE